MGVKRAIRFDQKACKGFQRCLIMTAAQCNHKLIESRSE
jgi:hypothetical protein